MSLPPVVQSKHCWIRPPQILNGWTAAILLEWRRGAYGYEGRVVWGDAGRGSASLREAWLPVDRIRPASGDQPI